MPTTRKPSHAKPKKGWVRWLRVVAYAMMALAGLMLLISPVLTEVYRATADVMAWFLLIGGALASVGTFRCEWWGEYIGLPLLGSAFGAFGVITYFGTHESYPYLAAGNLLLLLGVGLAMGARWRDARHYYQIAAFGAKHKDEEPL